MDQKLADGWIYGVEKDAESKTHPCLLPYAELPVEQRRKDALFRAIVQSLTLPMESQH
jgi:RyR domain